MKSQVFKTKENQEWLNVILPVSVVLLMVLSIFVNKMVETNHQNIDYEKKYIEFLSSPIATKDVLQSENSVTEINESAIDNAMEMKIREYLQPEIEMPLEVEDWMLNEKYWSTESKKMVDAD